MTPLNRKFRFTQREIDRLPPCPDETRSKSYECSDADVIGLRIMVTKSGRKFWFWRYNIRGRKRAARIGEYPATDLAAARKRAMEMRAQLDAGKDPQDEIEQRRAMPTFAEFVHDEYLPMTEQTLRSHKDNVSRLRHLLPTLGSKRMSDITTRDVQALITAAATRYSPATSNRILALLSRIMRLAVIWGVIEKNPCFGMKKFKEQGRERFLSNEEIARLYQALDADKNIVAASAIKFLLLTGMRRSEATLSTWGQVDLEQGLFYLPMTKSGKSRHVALNAQAIEVLMNLLSRGRSKYVFPGTHGDRPMAFLDRAFKRIMQRARIDHVRVHDLRHTYASVMAREGVPLLTISRALGHASVAMTNRYSHLCDKVLTEATNEAGMAIARATGKGAASRPSERNTSPAST